LKDHDLFHLRYGKGAVIIAVKKENTESSKKKWDQSEKAIRDNDRCPESQHKFSIAQGCKS